MGRPNVATVASTCTSIGLRESGQEGRFAAAKVIPMERSPVHEQAIVLDGRKTASWVHQQPLRFARSTRGFGRLAAALVLIAMMSLLSIAPSLAQMRPDVRDRVIPAAVQIAIHADVTTNGVTEPRILPVGSGTIVSADGLILTNWHVVNMADYRHMFDGWEAQAA
jgi:S1-C subfamily serine protease